MSGGEPGRMQEMRHVKRFAVIGDLHGCLPHVHALLRHMDARMDAQGHLVGLPDGRTPVFVGDLTDRGRDSAGVLELVMKACEDGVALAVLGNHDDKLLRALRGHAVVIGRELADTLASLSRKTQDDPGFPERVAAFLARLPHQLLLDDGRVIVVHAAAPERLQGKPTAEMRRFALYGDVDGTVDVEGKPVRRDWGAVYAGTRHVVYGHAMVETPEWRNRTIDIDTGCWQTGVLTALLWPEATCVQITLTPPASPEATPPDSSPETAPDPGD